jgi:type I restriction enzyme M protein
MVKAVDPRCGETVYDPCCGTGGFLAQAYEYVRPRPGSPPW